MLRNSLLSNSDKIEFDLGRDGSNRSEHRVQVAYRESGSVSNAKYSTSISLSTDPIWLRIVRDPDGGSFKFYYLQQSSTPALSDWPATPYYTLSASSFMGDTLYVGVFHSTYANRTYRTSEFDNFTILDFENCPTAQGQPEQELPPGLRVCQQPMSSSGFEGDDWLAHWKTEPNVSRVSAPKQNGFFSLSAPSFDSNFRNPWFYQKIQMPGWILSDTTTIDFSTFKYVDQLSDGADSHDEYQVALVTQPPPAFSQITSTLQTTFVATATVPLAVGNETNKVWNRRLLSLQAAPGINLEDYTDQELYLLFYNNTNAQAKASTGKCPPSSDECGATKFYFDDMDLTICTEQPLPANISTQIAGTATLFRSTGTQRVAWVKVWAYSQGGTLYETFTIQNGVFNFFNLPASNDGIKYFLYAEYHIVDELDPSQVETLIGQASVILKNSNDGNNPVVTALKLQ